MSIYGYHRTSTKDQHLDRGLTEIENYCKTNNLKLKSIFVDQQTGKNFNRPRYTVLVEDVLRSDDWLIVTELDRLGRNKRETMREIQRLKGLGIRLLVLELPTTLMDFSKMDNALAKLMLETINNMMLELYASMAEAEMEKKEKRQKEGIAAKKARGEWDDYEVYLLVKENTKEERMEDKRIGILVYDEESERYDIRFDLASYYGGLHCGDQFEVRVKDVWIPVRIELHKEWYLIGLTCKKLDGLIVRI